MNQNDVVQGDNLTLSEVITGKQAPDPAHEYGTVSPPPSSPDQSYRNEDEVPQPNVSYLRTLFVFFYGYTLTP